MSWLSATLVPSSFLYSCSILTYIVLSLSSLFSINFPYRDSLHSVFQIFCPSSVTQVFLKNPSKSKTLCDISWPAYFVFVWEGGCEVFSSVLIIQVGGWPLACHYLWLLVSSTYNLMTYHAVVILVRHPLYVEVPHVLRTVYQWFYWLMSKMVPVHEYQSLKMCGGV